MNPYVIDKQKQVTIYVLFVIGVIFSFVLGFVFGYQLASTGSIAGALSQQSAPAIEQTDTAGELSETNKSDSKEPVDTVTAKTPGTNQASNTAAKTQKVIAKPPPTKQTNNQTSTATVVKAPPKPVSQPKPQVSVQQPKSVIKPPVPKPVVKPVVTKPEVQKPVKPEVAQPDASTLGDTTATNQKAQYSVQAGLFASRDNAVKFLDELLGNGFDAYLQDFVSTSGAVKYNVRFGRSEDRELVKKRLEEFQQAFTTPAYIVLDN